MSGVLAPGVAQAVIAGTVSGHKFAQLWHFDNPTPGALWTPTQCQTVANTLFNTMKADMAQCFGSNVEYNSVTVTDIGTSTPATAVSTGAPWAGTATGTDLSPNLSQMVNFHLAARYRGGHARTYFPPSSQVWLDANDDQWLATQATLLQTQLAATISAVVTALPGVTHCVQRYSYTYTDVPTKHKYTHTRATTNGPPLVVQGYSTSLIVRNQRRRLTS